MSTTRPRAPINEHADPLDLDEGTLMRTESAPPGTIGLKGRSAKEVGASTDPVSSGFIGSSLASGRHAQNS
jgi:hypothetical protein